MRIAIVGAGISGLVAAYKLHAEHEIVVYESQSKPGGHSNTVPVEWNGESYAIDTGFIVYNDWTYPEFVKLLQELRVPTQPTLMGFSVRDEQSGLEYAGQSLSTLFAQRRNLVNPRFHRMLWDIIRFNKQTQQQADGLISTQTVGEFLQRGRYSTEFAEFHLLPMGAAIWSCPTGVFREFPMRFVIEFYRNHGLLNLFHRPTWRVITGGSHNYVNALVAGFRNRLRLNQPVREVQRLSDHVKVFPQGGEPERFDHLIFACHSDQALRILGAGATPAEKDILSKFPYSRNLAVLHTDVSVLPRQRRAWASWNFRVSGRSDDPARVTYNMNILQGLHTPHTFCVTLNDEARIKSASILGCFEYEHPIFTIERNAAQARHTELLTANRTSFCGAYWRNGFHEDGVVSALAVVNALQEHQKSTPATVNSSFPHSGEKK